MTTGSARGKPMPPAPRVPRLTPEQRRARRDIDRMRRLVATAASAEQLAEVTGRPLAWAQRVLEARQRRVGRRPSNRRPGRPDARGPQP